MKELKGKDINEVIAEGSSKLASMPSGVCVCVIDLQHMNVM